MSKSCDLRGLRHCTTLGFVGLALISLPRGIISAGRQ